jgi:hypothetical protein
MAGFQSISATSNTIARVVNACFTARQPVSGKSATAVVIRSEDFDSTTRAATVTLPALAIFLYRIEINKNGRPPWSAAAHEDGRAHLPLDLHYLITAWGNNAEEEQLVLGRAMQCLEEHTTLQGPLLDPSAGWAAAEVVQLLPVDVSTDTVARAFASFETDYRLSVSYLARVVRIDGREPYGDETVKTVISGLVPSLEP